MKGMDIAAARRQLGSLKKTLQHLVDRDPDQEVRGIAVPVLDTVISEVRGLLPEDAVVQSVRDMISPEAIGEGEPIGAADALVVVAALEAALPVPDPLQVVRDPDAMNWRTMRF